jgi:hypothetical protein
MPDSAWGAWFLLIVYPGTLKLLTLAHAPYASVWTAKWQHFPAPVYLHVWRHRSLALKPCMLFGMILLIAEHFKGTAVRDFDLFHGLAMLILCSFHIAFTILKGDSILFHLFYSGKRRTHSLTSSFEVKWPINRVYSLRFRNSTLHLSVNHSTV